jgi:hypothetical protein
MVSLLETSLNFIAGEVKSQTERPGTWKDLCASLGPY